MTDEQIAQQAIDLIDQAWQHLALTTDNYPTWKKKGYPANSNWAKAKQDLYTAQTALRGILPAQPTPTPPPATANPVPPPTTGVALGAYIDLTTLGVTTFEQGIAKFEQDAGKKLAHWMFGVSGLFSTGIPNLVSGLNTARSLGLIPVVDCSTAQTGTLAEFATGKYDAGIDAVANAIADGGGPVILRIDCEMNGGWYPYGQEIRGQDGIQHWQAAWQRIVTRIRAITKLCAFHWCPNVDPDHYQTITLEQVWPGDAYVDWAGFTGYNHGNEQVGYVFDDAYQRVTALTKKPIQIGETGSSDKYGYTPSTNPTKPQWTADFGKWLQAHSQVKSFCWFNWHITEGGTIYDWEIESTPAALAAFRTLAAQPWVVGR